MPFISKDFIKNKLLPNLDIVQVLQQYLTLKKHGSNYMCCCPFHAEKTPSFSVNPTRQFFYCFGCQEHGTVIDFVIKYKNETFPEAIEELARFAGLEVEYEESGHSKGSYRPDPDRNKVYYELLDRVASYFAKELYQPSNQAALDYFLKQRQLSPDVISKARLGYAPRDMYALQNAVIKSEEEAKILCELGVVKATPENGPNKRYRTFFFDRVMFPIFDVKGRIIAFGGRILKGDGPKYLNSPESKIFQKRHELFGIYECLQANRNRPESIVMVEGYMDVIALRKAGFTNVVATLGTACNSEHFKLLFRYTNKVICCYDGDTAGRKASWKALIASTHVTPEDKEVRFATIPAGEDPDSLVRSEGGKERFQNVLDSSIGYTEQVLLHCRTQDDVNDIEGLRRFINVVLGIAKALNSKGRQNAIVMLLSEVVNLNTSRLYEIMRNVAPDPDFQDHEAYERERNSSQERSYNDRSHGSNNYSQSNYRSSGTYARKGGYNSNYPDRGGRGGYNGGGYSRSNTYDYNRPTQPRTSQAFQHEALTPFHGSYAHKAYGQGAQAQANQNLQESQQRTQTQSPSTQGSSGFNGSQSANQAQFYQGQYQAQDRSGYHGNQQSAQVQQGSQANTPQNMQQGGGNGSQVQGMQGNVGFNQQGQQANWQEANKQGQGFQGQQGYAQNQQTPWQNNEQNPNYQQRGNFQSQQGGYVNPSFARAQGNSNQGQSQKQGQYQGQSQNQGGGKYQVLQNMGGNQWPNPQGQPMQQGQQGQGNFNPNGMMQGGNAYPQGGNCSMQGGNSQAWSNPQGQQGQGAQGGSFNRPYSNNANQGPYQGQGSQGQQGYYQGGPQQWAGPNQGSQGEQGNQVNQGNWSNPMSQGNLGMNQNMGNMGYGMNQGSQNQGYQEQGQGANGYEQNQGFGGNNNEPPSNVPQIKGQLVEVDPRAKVPIYGGEIDSPEYLFTLTDDERFTYFSLVGHDYDPNVDLNASVYQFMAFILQEPSVIVMGCHTYDYLNFLALCQGFRVPEYPCLERLMRLVTTISDPTCAKLMEEFRDTEFYPLFSDLSHMQILGKHQGDLDDLSTRDLLLLNRSLMLQILKDSVERRLQQLQLDFRMPRYKELEANLGNMLIRFMFLEDRMDKDIDLEKCNRFSAKITEMINDIVQDKKRNYFDGTDPSKAPTDDEHAKLLAAVPTVVDDSETKNKRKK